MNKKTSYVLLAAAALVILGFLWRYESHAPSPSDSPQTTEENQNTSNNPVPQKPSGNFWEGTLEKSNNQTKGNLMLNTGKGLIYINTSRDYSDLLGKQVRVNYEGNLENFVLGDIVAK